GLGPRFLCSALLRVLLRSHRGKAAGTTTGDPAVVGCLGQAADPPRQAVRIVVTGGPCRLVLLLHVRGARMFTRSPLRLGPPTVRGCTLCMRCTRFLVASTTGRLLRVPGDSVGAGLRGKSMVGVFGNRHGVAAPRPALGLCRFVLVFGLPAPGPGGGVAVRTVHTLLVPAGVGSTEVPVRVRRVPLSRHRAISRLYVA